MYGEIFYGNVNHDTHILRVSSVCSASDPPVLEGLQHVYATQSVCPLDPQGRGDVLVDLAVVGCIDELLEAQHERGVLIDRIGPALHLDELSDLTLPGCCVVKAMPRRQSCERLLEQHLDLDLDYLLIGSVFARFVYWPHNA